VICTASSGFDNIDVKHTKNRRINVLNVPDGNFVPAAEHTFGLILAISKNIIGAHLKMKKRKFDSSFRNFELQGKRIGIIGVGRVGSYVARIAKSFNMRVLGNDIDNSVIRKYKWIRFLPLNDLIESCDIVSVHTPLDNSTVDLLNGKNLKLLRSNAVLINCARGGIVNEKALIDLLKRKKIYYAGLDVFKNEPEIDKRFCTLGNVILSPHLAGKTIESAERISVQLAERIVMYFKKK
jgi:phosphoglycerate dehydrogenase-like enzyme